MLAVQLVPQHWAEILAPELSDSSQRSHAGRQIDALREGFEYGAGIPSVQSEARNPEMPVGGRSSPEHCVQPTLGPLDRYPAQR